MGNQTICPTAKYVNGKFQNYIRIHNNFGTNHAKVTANFGKMKPIFTHSSSPGISSVSGVYTGNYSTEWNEMERNLKEVLELSIAGVPLGWFHLHSK